MHNNAIKHFVYELRETTLDFWCLFAREWGDVRSTMVAYGGTETGHIDLHIAA